MACLCYSTCLDDDIFTVFGLLLPFSSRRLPGLSPSACIIIVGFKIF